MHDILVNIQKYLVFWLLGATAAGLASVRLSGGYAFTPAICILAALVMIYPSLVPLNFSKFREIPKYYGLISVSLLINFIFVPGLAVLLGYLFLADQPALWLGLLLISVLPGGGMVTTWALKSKADMSAAVGIVLANLAAMIVVVPNFLSVALNRLGERIAADASAGQATCALSSVTAGQAACFLGGEISPLKIAGPILVVVGVPLFLAYLTQAYFRKQGEDRLEKAKAVFGQLSNAGLIVVLFALMAIKDNAIVFSNPGLVLKSIIPLALFYGITLVLVMAIYSYFLKNEQGKALLWGSYLRYITLALGLATSLIFQNSALSLMVIIIMLSYFIQIPASFLVARYLGRG